MDTTLKSNGIKLLIGDTVITISPANGAVPTKRAYRKRKALATGEARRPVGRPRKVPVPEEA